MQLDRRRAHLADETVQFVWRAAAGRLALVTDAIAAAGVGDGRFRLSGVDVEVVNGVARKDDGTLAGSVVTMIHSVRNLHALGASLSRPSTPRRSSPLVCSVVTTSARCASAAADVVVLDDRLELSTVLLAGRERAADGGGATRG